MTGIDAQRNALVVGPKNALFSSGLAGSKLHLLSTDSLQPGQAVQARIRHNHKPAAATIQACSKSTVTIGFEQPQLSVTPGQAVVLYDDDIVLGGAVIENPLENAQPGPGSEQEFRHA